MTPKTDRERTEKVQDERRAYIPPGIAAEDDIETEALLQALIDQQGPGACGSGCQ